MLRFRKFPVAKSLWISGGGGYQGFPSKVFRVMLPKNFGGEPFSVSLFSGVEKFCASEGYFTIFRRIFCCLTVPKVSVGESFSLLNI